MQPKIKMSKHINSKLPDVFIPSRNKVKEGAEKKRQQRPQTDKEKQHEQERSNYNSNNPTSNNNNVASNTNLNANKVEKKQGGGKKKSRNPFFNVRQYLKLSKQMDEKMKQVRQQLELDRFSHLNLQSSPQVPQKQEPKPHRIRYQDCLTLNQIKKNQLACFKKILHVPTLTVYFLRQSCIDFSIDKSDLQEWIRKCNTNTQGYAVRGQKIVQLYWNIPEGYYSLIYQYVDGVLFDLMVENISIFPINFVQNMALTHLKSDFQIFNSILIIKRTPQSQVAFLPVYEQTDDIIPQYRTYRQLLKITSFEQNHDIQKIEKMLVAKLGFLVLITFFSEAIIDEDIGNILFESRDCCLFHKLVSDNSLVKIYFQSNVPMQSQRDILSDFLCRVLKFKPDQRATFAQLSKHKFFKTRFTGQICKMHEVIHILESTGSGTSSKGHAKQLSMHKLGKIINNMALILQGCSQSEKKQVNLNQNNENVRYILQDLGLGGTQTEIKINANQLINKLRKMYDL